MKRSARCLAADLVRQFTEAGRTVSTAESCTGGLIAKLITDIPGSSAVLKGGCVSYTNEIKEKVLGVDPKTIETDTEVSLACAREMADGARRLFGTDVAVSTTGYAGPGGGTTENPVGTVYIGISTAAGTRAFRMTAPSGSTRAQVRLSAAKEALFAVINAADGDFFKNT